MATANRQAQRFGHNSIGTEHIFLGLLKEDAGKGAKILRDHGVDTEKMLLEIEQLVQPRIGPKAAVSQGKIPPTPPSVQAVKFAVEEARALNQDYIGTEHLLLGLLRETDGIAAQVLANLGVKLEAVRESLRCP